MHNQVDCECGVEESQNHTLCEGAEMQEPGSQPHCENDADMQESVTPPGQHVSLTRCSSIRKNDIHRSYCKSVH